MKKFLQSFWLLMPLAFILGMTNANAQINYSQNFETAGLNGWSSVGGAGWTNQTSLPCQGLNSPRVNIYSSAALNTFTSPLAGTSNGGLITMSFEYKVTDWSAGTVATPATFGTINVKYGPTINGPWTTAFVINSSNHLPSASCATVNVPAFAVPPGAMFVQFESIWAAGDYWIYLDNIQISQGAAPTCAQPTALAAVPTSSGASLSWTENGTATAWDVQYGLAGFAIGTGTTVAASSNPFAITGLSPNTNYSYYVRANCGAGSTSFWSGPFNFTTLCSSQLSGTFTINAGAPASATNFQSFSALAFELNACGISGPVTVNVVANSGPYNERFVLNQITGSSATNTITINGNGNVLTFNATASADRATMLLNGTDYVSVNNLKIHGTSLTLAHALHLINGADYNSFSNCEFRVPANSTNTNVNTVCLSGTLTSALSAGNTGNFNTFSNNYHLGGYYTFTVYGTSGTSTVEGNKILNSVFEDYYLAGVYLSNTLNSEVIGNDMSRKTRTTITSFYGIYLLGTSNNGAIVRSNRIHDNATAAPTNTSLAYPLFISGASSDANNPVKIINNIIYNIKGNGVQSGMYIPSTAINVQIYHNTVILDNTTQTGTSAITGIHHLGVATNTDIRNNIVYVNNGNTGIKRVLWYVNTAPVMISNNNVLINMSTTGTNHLVTLGTTNYATLAAWQAASGSTFDQNSVSADPVFTSAANGNLKPLSAAVDNIGASVGITTDITGGTRSTTAPDAGAHEFTGVGADVALTSGSLLRGLCYSTNDTVSLTITNLIGTAVDLSVTPITATWSVTGTVNSSGSIVFNTGTLAVGASISQKAGGLNMSAGGTYVLNAFIAPNTVNTVAGNDTLAPVSRLVSKLLAATPTTTTIVNTTDTVELKAFSPFFPNGGFFISEICHFRGSATGVPTGGWPSYMLSDDFIEITGSPFSDLGGITLEQWTTTALAGTFTFPSGTILNAQGTAVIAVGEMGASVPSPANNYYHGNGTYTGSWGSTTASGRILKDALGNIIDVVGYGAFTFPAAAGVTAAQWTGSTTAANAGIRLIAPDNNTNTSWAAVSTTVLQNPNAINSGVTAPAAPAFTGFNWNLNGSSVSTNATHVVGPFTSSGTYKYVAAYNSTQCGMIYDTATVVVQLPVYTGQIGFGTTVPGNTLYTPVYRFSNTSTTRFNRALTIYTEAEMIAAGIAPGSTIQKLAFDKAGVGATNGVNQLYLGIWMGTSNKTAPLAAQDWATSVAGKAQVFADSNVTIPGTSGWVTFEFDSPFVYTGGTLEIAFENSISGASPFATDKFDWKYDPIYGTNHNIGSVSAGTTYSTSNLTSSTLYSWRPNTLFTYSPAAGPEAGLVAMTSPVNNVACSSPQLVSVRMESYGLTNVTSATINWLLNGVAQTPVAYNGNLAAGQNAIINLGNVTPAAGINTIKAWIASAVPGSGVALNDTVNASFTSGISGTFTVNSAQTTGGSNFQSFSALASALSTNGICGPIVVNVAPGSGPYNEQVSFNTVANATSTNTITINGNGNTITFLSTNTNARHTVLLNGVDYLTIKNLNIVAQGALTTPAEFGYALQMLNNSDFVTVDSCNITATDNSTSANFVAFAASGSAISATTNGSPGTNLTIKNSILKGGYYGITYASTGGVNNILFENNTVKDFYLYGIYAVGTANGMIKGNDVNRATRVGAVSTFYGIYLSGSIAGTQVLNNRIHDISNNFPATSLSAYPFYLTAASGSPTNPFVIANNLVYNINNNAGIQYGLYYLSGDHFRIYHNTIDLNNALGTGTSAIRGIFISPIITNGEVRNNIVSVSHANTGIKHALYYNSSSTGLVSNNNVLYMGSTGGTGNHIAFWGANQTTLSDYQTASNRDLLSIAANPTYTNTILGNLTPTNAVVDNVGLPVGILTDINGATRSTTTPDAGGIEFTLGAITCPQPTLAGVSGITPSSAVMNWTEAGTATNWTIAYGPVGFNPSLPANKVAEWDFNASNLTPSTGTGTISLFGGVTNTYASGFGSTDPVSGTNNAINTTAYPAQGTGNKTAGVQFAVNTTGLSNIRFGFDIRLSNTAANTWTVQYTTDLSAATPVWVDAATYTYNVGSAFINNQIVDLRHIAGLNNNANAGIRIVSAFAPGGSTYVAAATGSTYGTAGTMRLDMVRITSSPANGGVRFSTGSNPATISGLASSTSYHAYVRANCGANDTSLWTGPISFTTAFQCPPNAICETFTTANLGAEYNTAPAPTALSTCPGSVTINVPAGNAISSVDVSYVMTAFNGAYISEQRTRLYSPTTLTGENMVSGPAISAGGVQAYNRSGLNFFNGATGSVQFQLHAFRTWGGSLPVCDTIYQYINKNTFRVVAYYAPAATCSSPTALATSNITSTSVNLAWTGTSSATSYKVQYGPTGFALGSGTVVTTATNSASITGLNSNTAYQFYVKSICGTADSSAYAGPVAATTLCGVFPLTFTETFETTSPSLSCWSQTANWALFAAGGFGTSATSIRFPFYSISSGTFDAITPTFTPTAAGDRLSFDHAYATYVNEVDSVVIFTSNDGGSTYTRLVGLAGGVNGPLVTAPPTTTSFVPTASQWSNYNIVLPTGTNKVKFTAKTAYGNNFYADNVKVGPAPVSLQPFTLNSPANNATLVVAGSAQSQININWRKSATGATYQWRAFLPGGSVNSPILTLPSNSSGADTVLTVTVGQVDAILASLGVNIGDTATIQWSVRAKLGTDSLFATTPYTLNLVRNGVASLQVVAAPQTNNATTQVRAPNGTATATYMRAATIVTAAEYANAGITANNNLRSMGFRFSAPSTGVMTGIMKIYLQNTTDATYSKGTAWTGITPGMTLVFDDTVTVAQGALVYDMEFTNQFVYSGSQVYVAYDWQMLSTAIPAQTYFANNVIAASLVSASSATAPPPTLGATAFRPELRWGVDRLPNDLEVLAIWAKGKNPLNFGAPEAIQAVVRNNGYLLASKSVSLNISGANTFTATANVSLASSQLDTITFAGFNPSNIGYNNITVSVPADDKTSNDSRSWAQLSTNDVYGYADSVLTGLSGVGYNTGGGLLLSRFEVNGVRSISGVNVHISSATTNVGNTVYAVVLDTAGNIVGQSANLVIANGDLNTWKNFLIPTNPVISNQPFYVGLAQVANAVTGYFPVSFQSENPTRPNAFFSATLTGATIAPVNGFRLMIEAVVTAPPTCPAPTNVVDVAGCTDASISWTSSAAMLKSKIEYGPAGFTPGSGTVVNNVTSPYTITGLSLNTSYDVYVTDSCQSGWSQAVGASLTTLNVPVASGSFTTTNGITFTFDGSASTGNPTSYSWNFGDGNTGSGVSVNHTYASSGTYTVTLIVVNDCGSDTATFPVTVQSIDQFGMGSVSLYPNPNTGLFQIIGLPVDGGDILVEVMSTTGAVVYRATVEQGNDVKEVDMRGYGPGVYQVRMTNNKGFGVMPFVLRN